MQNNIESSRNWLAPCLLALLAATLAINLLSGFIRHTEAGLGCPAWPDCYGQVGVLLERPADQSAAVAALTPTETAKRYHRAIATGLVILVLLVVAQARTARLRGFARYLPYLLLLVILLLSVIGPASYLKTLPAVATINLIGGMALLALTWWLWLAVRATEPLAVPHLARPASLALLLLCLQLLLGAWTSANFAGTACSGLWDCSSHADTSGNAFWYFRELDVDDQGRILMGNAQVLIHQTHRLAAVLVGVVLFWFGTLAFRTGGTLQRWGAGLMGLVAAQLALGAAVVSFDLPRVVVLGHNLVASLLLLCLIRMRLLVQPQEPA